MKIYEEVFGSKARSKLLETIFAHPETGYYGRLIQRATGLDHKAVWTELKFLEEIGIIESELDGRLKRYRLRQFDGLEDLSNFVLKNAGKLKEIEKTTKLKSKSSPKAKDKYRKSLFEAQQLMLELDS
ncbi:MAG: hypothetical protein QMD53_00770 [Actinomycetota bacterium]|nr:hypothetical protein [Actinomycetota bacterium]